MPYFFLFLLILLNNTAQAQNSLNPDISLNTLFTYQQGTQGNSQQSENPNGFSLQEAELRLNANIDAYFRGDVILAVEKAEQEYIVEPEEVFIETLSLPDVTLRLGKFYPFWGRSNQWHTHAFPFVDAFQTREAIFGEEGFNETGLAVSYLLPTSWYSEGVLQLLSAQNAKVFNSTAQDDVAGIYFFKNLWDLNDTTTLEFDLGYGHGHDISSQQNHIYNSAITIKYKKNDRHSLIFSSEFTSAEKVYDENDLALNGYINTGRTSVLSNWLQWQLDKRWWLQTRYELIRKNHQQEANKYSALCAFIPTEFSAVRLQYDNMDYPWQTEIEHRFSLQFNLTMGVHPAHNY